MPGSTERPCGSKPTEAERLLFSLSVDEHVTFRGFAFLREEMPPTLYVDDFTVLREVSDVCTLRAGDHCVVGVADMGLEFGAKKNAEAAVGNNGARNSTNGAKKK